MTGMTSRLAPAAALLLALVALAACIGASATGPPTPAPETVGASPGPTVPSNAVPSPGPGATQLTPSSPARPCACGPAVPQAATPAPMPSHPAVGDLVARVFILPDVYAGPRPPPTLSVYADGRVIDGGLRWLTPEGVNLVAEEFLGSGFFGQSRAIPTGPIASGFTAYAATLRTEAGLVTVETTNANPTPEGRRFIDLLERLAHPEAWLPEDAWLPGWSQAQSFEPDRWLLVVWLQGPQAVGPPTGASPDISVVDWPFDEPIERFGAEVLGGPAYPGLTRRCGIVPAAQAERLFASLRSHGQAAPPDPYQGPVTLGWAATGGDISLDFGPGLPDDGTACTATGTPVSLAGDEPQGGK